MLPNLAGVADDICLVTVGAHRSIQSCPSANCFSIPDSRSPAGRAWALGSRTVRRETSDLPAFVVMSTGSGISGGAANWSSGFLPTVYSGVRFRNQGDPILNVTSPPGVDGRLQRETLDLVGQLNHDGSTLGDPEIVSIAADEMAFRLQTSAPELMDLRSECRHARTLWCDPDKPSFARAACSRGGWSSGRAVHQYL